MTVLPISLSAAAAAALINFWLAMRIGQIRMKYKVLHGDGGNELLMQRMRAQLNFVENTVFVLVLIVLLEIAGFNPAALLGITVTYMAARIAHGIGMDSAGASKPRKIGTIVTMLTQLVLAGAAIGTAAHLF